MESRAVAFADVDLFVNICSAIILIFGLGAMLPRFGVTASLLLTPSDGRGLSGDCSPQLLLIQAGRATQRISQYAIASPAARSCSRWWTSRANIKPRTSSTTVYRFGDLTSAWMLAGLRAAGFGLLGAMTFGIAVSAAWGAVAVALGRRYEALGGKPAE